LQLPDLTALAVDLKAMRSISPRMNSISGMVRGVCARAEPGDQKEGRRLVRAQ